LQTAKSSFGISGTVHGECNTVKECRKYRDERKKADYLEQESEKEPCYEQRTYFAILGVNTSFS